MITFAACLDEHRLAFAEYRAFLRQIERAAGDVRRVDMGLLARSIAAQHSMLDAKQSRLAAREGIGRILAAVAAAHERDPDALAAVIGKPISN